VTQSGNIYDSPRLASAYAYDRPPVHQRIIDAIRSRLRPAGRLGRALDIGCGAGVSTGALAPLAEHLVGLEPMAAMLTHCREVAPHALFLVGQAEHLPFRAGTFHLIAAAGALNYADVDRCLPDVARVLAPSGVLIIYDFSAGRRMREGPELSEWFATFEHRYPSPPGYALDVRGLPYHPAGLRLTAYDELEVAVPMTLGSYVRYVLSATSVERAIASGVPERAIRDWCQSTLADILGDTPRDVLFSAYIAYVNRAAP
jgi:SAM-dependent methyltransferase